MALTRGFLFVLGACALAAALALPAAAQSTTDFPPEAPSGPSDPVPASGDYGPQLVKPVLLPRMAPELALVTYENRLTRQTSELGFSFDTVIIRAELPETKQKGEYEFKRVFFAPKTLTFAAGKFVGDNFVKTNVILRLLQSEQDHVEKGTGGDVSITSRNYKFSFKRSETVDGRTLHVFQVKPRKKRVGLFKGHVYLDAFTGSLVRVEGSLVKSPSWFIKKVDFTQEYADISGFTLPVHIHSDVRARIVGRTEVDIVHRDYEARSLSDVQQQQATPAASASRTQN